MQGSDSGFLPQDGAQTHEVSNQSPAFEDVNLFASDTPLAEAVIREGAGWAADSLARLGAIAGSGRVMELGRLANENAPKLRRFDQKGFPLDTVEFHPAYHELMALSFREGLHASTWDRRGGEAGPEAQGQQRAQGEQGAHVARAARLYLISQAEAGHICPMTMTHASVPALRGNETLLARLAPKLASRDYDPAFAPISGKRSITIGMGMTEKQGGTDVRANTTRAEPLGVEGFYAITGHKWFMSAPMCDAFLVLAQAPGGLSCFFLPRFRDDGLVNAIRIQRLKDKLGNRSNASSEVEFHAAEARLIGEEGRGVAAIMEMVTLTRLDCAVASAGLMRFALANALRHARHRTVFQKALVDQPLMARVLADLALDSEAATALALRLAGSFDHAGSQPEEAAFRRLMTPVIKYFVCKSAPSFAYEAMECLGGNGYVEEGPMARAYREAPLNAIWEGSGNVMCLDILRVLQRDPDAVEAVFAAIALGVAGDAHLSAALDALRRDLSQAAGQEADARSLAERLALLAAGALLRMHAPDYVADAFIASRFGGGWRQTYGAGLRGADSAAILARAGNGL
jgi:putative acyl-CoA dehydrogenase